MEQMLTAFSPAGRRAFARYPILWGLKRVQGLPNPDPSDTGDWDKKLPKLADIVVDPDFEVNRLEWRKQAQEWAGLDVDPEAELFVFVREFRLPFCLYETPANMSVLCYR